MVKWPWGHVWVLVWDHAAMLEMKQGQGRSLQGEFPHLVLPTCFGPAPRPGIFHQDPSQAKAGTPLGLLASSPETSPMGGRKTPTSSGFPTSSCLALPWGWRWGGKCSGPRPLYPPLHQLLQGPKTPDLPFQQALKKSENKRLKKVSGCKSEILGHEYGKSSY